mmetsp:Transcript_14825/g.62573  ORF Transcript_14825/g.62573 Transcript_14825/m.62573 type:complete len:209 (-) Transcript_14825:3556-4182(-)
MSFEIKAKRSRSAKSTRLFPKVKTPVSSAGAHAHSICHARTLRLCVGDPRRYVSRANSSSAPETASSATRRIARAPLRDAERYATASSAKKRSGAFVTARKCARTSAATRAGTSVDAARLRISLPCSRCASRARYCEMPRVCSPSPARPSSKISRAYASARSGFRTRRSASACATTRATLAPPDLREMATAPRTNSTQKLLVETKTEA